MASLEQSTQLQKWMFPNTKALKAKRKSVRDEFMKRREGKQPPLSEEAEWGFHNVYLNLLTKLSRKAEMNSRITEKYSIKLLWTAAILFKRFYLKHSLMDVNPVLITCVAIYVAGKVEELPLTSEFRGVNVKALARMAGIRPELVINKELMFLKELGFEIMVHTAVLPFGGFMDKLVEENPNCEEQLNALRAAAKELLQQTLFTDLIFVYNPPQLAIASILAASEGLKNFPFSKEEILNSALLVQPSEENVAKLLEMATAVQTQVASALKSIESVSKGNRGKTEDAWVSEWNKIKQHNPANKGAASSKAHNSVAS